MTAEHVRLGRTDQGNADIVLGPTQLNRHMMLLNLDDEARASTMGRIIAKRITDNTDGTSQQSVTVIDPEGDLTDAILAALETQQAQNVRWLDFRSADNPPNLNMISPDDFPHRDRCVSSIVSVMHSTWRNWGSRVEETVRIMLELGFEHNRNPDNQKAQMSPAQALGLASDVVTETGGRSFPGHRLKAALDACADQDVKNAVHNYSQQPRETRRELEGAISRNVNRMRGEARDRPSPLDTAQGGTNPAKRIADGGVTIVTTARARLGNSAAALLSAWTAGIFAHVVRENTTEQNAPQHRQHLLACDRFCTVPGAPWRNLLVEARRQGGTLWLSEQELPARDDNAASLLAHSQTVMAGPVSVTDAKRLAITYGQPYRDPAEFTTLNDRQIILRAHTPGVSVPPVRVNLYD